MSQVQLGVDLTSTPADSGTNYQFGLSGHKLGSIHVNQSGDEYMFVHAAGAITQYAWVSIDESFEAAMLTKALADKREGIGVAQVAFADNDYGWVLVRGSGTGLFKASCVQDVALYTSATAGYLDDDATAQTKVLGPVLITTLGGADASGACRLTVIPHVG